MAKARSLSAPCRPGSTLNTAEPWSSSRGSGSMRWMRSAGQDRPNCSTTARLRSSSLTISAMRPSSKPNAPLLQHPASRGIGFAIARGLAEAGARVLLNGRDPDRLREAARALTDLGLDAESSVFDVADTDAARAALRLPGAID